MSKEMITVCYEVHQGDVTGQYPFRSSRGQVVIMEVLDVDFEQGEWVITNPEENIPQWVGRHEFKQQAILNYLTNRLGMYEVNNAEKR